jgi:hypothetical protein
MAEKEEEEEESGYALDKAELELFHEVLFKRIMDVMDKPEVDSNPFEEMIKILSRLSEIFSFKSMISIIPELVAYAVRYGMLVEQAYDKNPTRLKEDEQGYNAEKEEKKRRSLIKKDLDKLSLYL